MRTKKTIAIIGATGNIGTAISKSISGSNVNLVLYGRELSRVNELIDEIKTLNPEADVIGSECPIDSSWEADIIILAVPYKVEREIAEKIKEVANQKIVISIANHLHETDDEPVTSTGASTADTLQELLPYSKIIKAFSKTSSSNFSAMMIAEKPVEIFLAGNNEEALQTAAEFLRRLNFNPVIEKLATQAFH